MRAHTHRHRPARERVRGFSAPAKGARRQVRAAHGNVTVTATCRCGLERQTNVNGRHVERGAWVAEGDA